MTTPDPVVVRYVHQLAQVLRGCGLPEDECREIGREIESHVTETVSAGVSVAQALARLGPPQELARSYALELLLPAKARGPRVWRQAATIASTAVAYLAALLLVLLGGSLAIVGAGGIVGSALGPWLPTEPALRAGLPQLVLGLVSAVALGGGLLLLRFVRVAWRVARARPLGRLTKESSS